MINLDKSNFWHFLTLLLALIEGDNDSNLTISKEHISKIMLRYVTKRIVI